MKSTFISSGDSVFILNYSTVKPLVEHLVLVLSSGVITSAKTSDNKDINDFLLSEIRAEILKDDAKVNYTGNLYIEVK